MNNLHTNDLLYLISNLFRMYVLYRLIGVFFNKSETNKRLEIAAFTAYYVLNSGASLLLQNPFVDLGTNIILYFLLTFIYQGKLATRIISTVLIYSTGMLLDSVIYNLFIHVIEEKNLKSFTNILSNVVFFVLVLVLERIYSGYRLSRINIVHMLAIFLIPVSSITIVITAFISNYSSLATIINVSLFLGINVLVFYLYDTIIQFYNDKYEKGLLKQQNEAYANEFELIKESNDNIRILRHDMKNHIITMQLLLQNDKKQELMDYLTNTFDHIDIETEYVRSGNADVDSILNYKIEEAKKIGAIVNASVNIPEKINIAAFDLSVILGNLLDNAIDALEKCEDKILQIEVELDRSVLYITVTNSFNGIVNQKNDKFITTKKDSQHHGIGLSSVESVISKFNGKLDIECSNQMFMVHILLYIPAS